MRHSDLLRLSLSAVFGQRLRSALTMLGIAVGIASVVLLTALGEGVRQFVLGEFTQFGTNIVAITPGKTTTFGVSGATISSVRPVTTDDAQSLYRVPGVEAVVPVIQGNSRVEFGARARRTTIIGVGADMPNVWRMQIGSGKFLPADPFERARSFVVLGSRMKAELFPQENPLGARVRIGNDRFTVIGVMAPKGQMLGFDLDDTAYIPIGKATELFNREGVMEIDITYSEEADADAVVSAIKRLLIARHGQEDFSLTTQDQMLDVLGDILGLLTTGVGSLGAISLIVGAFGVATIMTIAVTERTGEVGLLRAIGASRRQILNLFLAEAALLGGLGGIVGVSVAVILVNSVTLVLPALPLTIIWPFAAAAMLVSFLIGILSGLLPALRAARMDPIEALRTE